MLNKYYDVITINLYHASMGEKEEEVKNEIYENL